MISGVLVVWFFRAQGGHGLLRRATRVGKAQAYALTSQTPQNDINAAKRSGFKPPSPA
jgi:hypothetical protein